MDSVIQMFKFEDQADKNNDSPKSSETAGSTVPTRKTHRTSHYTIYVDLPDNAEEMVLVHGYLGHRIKVTKTVATYLRSLEEKSPPSPLYGQWQDPEYREINVKPPGIKTLEMLQSRGFLTKRTYQQELAFFKQLVELKTKRATRHMPLYLFMPTYSCNLRCPYCFQDHMRTDPNFNHLLTLMDKPTVDRIFDAMPEIERNHGYTDEDTGKRQISFFGGEPLLKENRQIIEYIMDKAKKLGPVDFSAISNATDLHHYKDLLGEEGIAEIQITLDGTPQEHDKRRVYPDGSGSFDIIAKNITMALDQGARVSVRLNIDHNNINELPELASIITHQGWTKYTNFRSYLAPIFAGDNEASKSSCMTTRQLDIAMKALHQQYPITKLFKVDADAMRQKAKNIFSSPQKETSGMQTQYCGAHNRMYIFDAFADIYACWEKTGDKNIRIGTVNKYTGLQLDKSQEEHWRSRTVASNKVCAQCRYAMHCGGGCAIIAESKTGMLHSNHCDSYGKRFRSSVAEAFTELQMEAQMEAQAVIA